MNATIHVVVKKFLMNVFEAKDYMNFINEHETFEETSNFGNLRKT